MRAYKRSLYLDGLIYESDQTCYEELRMDRFTFKKLCDMLHATGRLQATRNMTVDEQAAMFLHILAHHLKNRTIKNHFLHYEEIVSRYFNIVLKVVLQPQGELLKTPELVHETLQILNGSGLRLVQRALDGMYIEVIVRESDKPRYQNRKDDIATNVLGVCSQDMQFIYVLPGWEGSAANGRILRDALIFIYKIKMEFDPPNGRRRGKGSKHVWTPEEDENLINCMLELKEKGFYNTEGGGFKHGVFKELERMLQIKLPGHGLKDTPHIKSRYKLLKRQYQHFYDLRVGSKGSRFGWDDNRKCLTANNEVWETLYAGKDRATGNNSEAPGDIHEYLDKEKDEESDNNTETLNDLDDSQAPTSKRTVGESSKQRQRKRIKSIDGLLSGLRDIAEMMGNHLKESREQMSNMINVIAAPDQ
ncbi:hypothetical protein BUALT_Bualt04G0023900 [Buddleja alternifolia]|uniref:Myb/SANT-like domain-containing protein n=1 Tax=Buddleja alternifolia TaxID=168488 RepID=A0AAV6XM17_9LAMI|nr:hypothetical protein BUALT_Bualt04G0023900 [Buddleja alternifolia]